MSGSARAEALARLDVLVGEWTVHAVFPGDGPSVPPGRSVFAWTLNGRFLTQRTEIPLPEAPDSLSIVSLSADGEGYVQHYFDSRGVTRLYMMTLTDGTWSLLREQADTSPLDFRQRFTGVLSEDKDTIAGTWEKAFDGSGWEHDFTLTYRRVR